MGLFGPKRTKEEQFVFAESNFYALYEKWASGKKCASKDDYFIADMHASYSVLQYLRELEDMVESLRSEVKELKDMVNKEK